MWESENQDESPLMTTDNFHGIDRLVMKDDTTQDVVRAGKNAGVGLKSMQVALQDAEAITARMQNSEFADRILKFAKKRDLKGLAELLGSATSKSQVQVKSVEDFKIEAIIITDGKQYYVCIGDGCHHHSGKKIPVVFEES
jgi:predicted xylose isomerase-like sugar epimerase